MTTEPAGARRFWPQGGARTVSRVISPANAVESVACLFLVGRRCGVTSESGRTDLKNEAGG